MKQFVRGVMRRFGLDVVRYRPDAFPKSVRTDAVEYVTTATGNYYLPRDAQADVIAVAIRQGRVFDEEIVNVARKYIRPGSVAIDVGANFGQMSVIFSDLVGPTGKVYAFDADDFVFSLLEKNVAANGRVGRIVPTFGAVHNAPNETLYFPVQDFKRFTTYGSYAIAYGATTGRPVPSLTIDSLDISGDISFMKIDVQGGDLLAMQGAVQTIAKHRMPILFEYEYQFEAELKLSFQAYVDFVRDIGYRFENVINGYNYLIVPR
jgi:FkbM family methyltransferase